MDKTCRSLSSLGHWIQWYDKFIIFIEKYLSACTTSVFHLLCTKESVSALSWSLKFLLFNGMVFPAWAPRFLVAGSLAEDVLCKQLCILWSLCECLSSYCVWPMDWNNCTAEVHDQTVAAEQYWIQLKSSSTCHSIGFWNAQYFLFWDVVQHLYD